MSIGDTVVIIDDDKAYARILLKILEPLLEVRKLKHQIFYVPEAGLNYINQHHQEISVIITDYKMPGMDGLDLIRQIEHPDRNYQIIILSGNIDHRITESVLHLNIFDFLEKQVGPEFLSRTVESAFSYYQEKSAKRERIEGLLNRYSKPDSSSNVKSTQEADHYYGIVGKSDSFKEIIKTIKKVANSSATCFIQGESGTGKELAAQAVHNESGRRDKPYTVINCGAIPKDLIESELFGHKKGSFTGATEERTGLIEKTDGGTLFLDEITEMPVEMQVKLLRFLQEGSVQPIGAAEPRQVNVRVIAASNRDMQEALKEGVIREDLFFRLNVIPIRLAPLREREGDIKLLLDYFIGVFVEMEKKPIKGYDDDVLEFFRSYYWPGNIREMRNIIHRIVLFAEGERISVADLPYELLHYDAGKSGEKETLESIVSLRDLEKSSIEKALTEANNNKEEAARLLGISRASVYRKIKEYDIRL